MLYNNDNHDTIFSSSNLGFPKSSHARPDLILSTILNGVILNLLFPLNTVQSWD